MTSENSQISAGRARLSPDPNTTPQSLTNQLPIFTRLSPASIFFFDSLYYARQHYLLNPTQGNSMEIRFAYTGIFSIFLFLYCNVSVAAVEESDWQNYIRETLIYSPTPLPFEGRQRDNSSSDV
jgi:hypothetical protein